MRRPKMQLLEEAPLLESGDKPAQQSTDAPTEDQSSIAQSTEESGDASDEKEIDDSALQQLDALDLGMARITEDWIDLLVIRKMINNPPPCVVWKKD